MTNPSNLSLLVLALTVTPILADSQNPKTEKSQPKADNKKKTEERGSDDKKQKAPDSESALRLRATMKALTQLPEDDSDTVVAEGVRTSSSILITKAELDEARMLVRQAAQKDLSSEELLEESKARAIRQWVCVEEILKNNPKLEQNPKFVKKLKRLYETMRRHLMIEFYVELEIHKALGGDDNLLAKLLQEEEERASNSACYKLAVLVFTDTQKAQQCLNSCNKGVDFETYLKRQELRDNATKFNDAYAALLARYSYELGRPLIVDGNIAAMLREDGYFARDTLYMPAPFWDTLAAQSAGVVCGPVEVILGEVKYFLVLKVGEVKPYRLERRTIQQLARSYVLTKLSNAIDLEIKEIKIVDKVGEKGPDKSAKNQARVGGA